MREGVSLRKNRKPVRKSQRAAATPPACYVISNMVMLMCLRRLKGKTQATVHGFRSSFRDWCADNGVPRELAEAVLPHTAAGPSASHRSDVIDLRRDPMRHWGNLIGPPVE